MKVFRIVGFNLSSLPWERRRRILEHIGRHDLIARGPGGMGFGEGRYYIEFPEDDARLEIIHLDLRALGINWSERVERRFDERDRQTAPLLRLAVRKAPKGFGGPSYGTAYDLSVACPSCGSGAAQISPLILKRSQLPKSGEVIETLDGETLVAQDVAQAIQEAGLTGLELRIARAHGDRCELPWAQLLASYTLPAMDRMTEGIYQDKGCQICRRDGHYESADMVPAKIAYRIDRSALDDFPDFVSTFELFGKGVIREPMEDSHLAQPLIIVRPRAYQILSGLKIRGLAFEPIEVCEPR